MQRKAMSKLMSEYVNVLDRKREPSEGFHYGSCKQLNWTNSSRGFLLGSVYILHLLRSIEGLDIFRIVKIYASIIL